MSLNDTTKLAPVLGLDYVLKELSPKNVSNDRLITSFPNVIKSMSDILLSTSKETIQSYYIWRVLYWFYPRVRAQEIDPARIFDNTLSGRVCAPSSRMSFLVRGSRVTTNTRQISRIPQPSPRDGVSV